MASLIPKTGILGQRLAAHLLRRTTFGPTKTEINTFASLTITQAVDQLLLTPPVPSHPLDPETGLTWVVNGADDNVNSPEWRLKNYVVAWWMKDMLEAPAPSLIHKMVFFIHTCLTTDMLNLESVDNYYTLLLFRQYALGSYKTLARKICMDNAMLTYLDARYSNRWNPNENFPRELLELFTIGKGPQIGPGNYTTYTEDDIKAAAKVITGFRLNQDWWDPTSYDPDTGLPTGTVNTNAHDPNDKVFTDAFVSPGFPSPVTIVGGNTEADMHRELDDLIEIIFAQDATAQYICRKLYRQFVHYDITSEIETDIIVPLATVLRTNNYDLSEVMKVLLKSEHFYDEGGVLPEDYIAGGLIKSPLEQVVSTIRFFKVQMPDPVADPDRYYRLWSRDTVQRFLLAQGGMELFGPPNVAGYPAMHQEPDFNRLWISTNTLPFRYTMADMFLTGQKVTLWGDLYMQIDVMAIVTDPEIVPDVTGPDPYDGVVGTYAGGRFADHVVRSLVEYAFPELPDPVRLDYFVTDLLLGNLSPINWRFEWVGFEARGDDSSIRPQLEQLVRGILQAPEFQLT